MMTAHPQAAEAQILAAAAPTPADDADDADDAPLDAAELAAEPDLHDLCERWAVWYRTRRLFVKPSLPASTLGRLTRKSSGVGTPGGPDADCSQALWAFNLAYLGQPMEALDRRVFELHYYWRVRNVKAAAAELGISRNHWYRLVRDFRARVYRSSLDIMAVNQAERDALSSRAHNSPSA